MTDDPSKVQNDVLDAHRIDSDQQTTLPGIVYISRIPPKMTPSLLRQILERYGKVGQLYLSPRDKNYKIIKDGKHTKIQGKGGFTEGWVEFLDKRIAKLVAETLNCTNMGARKSDLFFDEIWTIKYLSKFKWHNLTEQLAYERRVRAQKLRTELNQVKRITDHYHTQASKARYVSKNPQSIPISKKSKDYHYKQHKPISTD